MEKVKRFKIPLFFVLSGIVLLPLIKGFLKLLEKSFNTSFGIGTIFIIWLLIDTIVILAINCIKTTKENAKIEVEGVNLKKKDGTFGTADWGTKEEIEEHLSIGKRDRIILGETENQEIITLPINTYLNKNIAVFPFKRNLALFFCLS